MLGYTSDQEFTTLQVCPFQLWAVLADKTAGQKGFFLRAVSNLL